MNEENLNSLNIDGLGTYGGGEFDYVNVSGKGTINGDLKCNSLRVSGMANINGLSECQKAKVSGSCKMTKDLTTEKLSISGTFKSEANIKTEKFKVSGMAKIKQSLNASQIHSSGILNVENDINSETINIDGMLNCNGLINCEELNIISEGSCKLKDIGASTIEIRQGRHSISKLVNLFIPNAFNVTASVIEGDDIYLEHCEAKIVRGKNIKIGKGCIIDTIEYSDTLEVDNESKVQITNKFD